MQYSLNVNIPSGGCTIQITLPNGLGATYVIPGEVIITITNNCTDMSNPLNKVTESNKTPKQSSESTTYTPQDSLVTEKSDQQAAATSSTGAANIIISRPVDVSNVADILDWTEGEGKEIYDQANLLGRSLTVRQCMLIREHRDLFTFYMKLNNKYVNYCLAYCSSRIRGDVRILYFADLDLFVRQPTAEDAELIKKLSDANLLSANIFEARSLEYSEKFTVVCDPSVRSLVRDRMRLLYGADTITVKNGSNVEITARQMFEPDDHHRMYVTIRNEVVIFNKDAFISMLPECDVFGYKYTLAKMPLKK